MQQPLPTILCLSFFPQNAAQDMKISELERKLKAKSDEARNLKVRQAHAMAGLQKLNTGSWGVFQAFTEITNFHYLQTNLLLV